MSILLRFILILAAWWAVRAAVRSWRLAAARRREHAHPTPRGRFANLSDQEVSDADFEEIP